MRWKLGSLVLGTLLVAFALSAPADASHTCLHRCSLAFETCQDGCAGNSSCLALCAARAEACRCGSCGICF